MVSFAIVDVTPEGWSAILIYDSNMNAIYDAGTDVIIGEFTREPRSEESAYYFFVALSSPVTAEETGMATFRVTSEANDGPAYFGTNGVLYGGDDEIEIIDKASPALTNLSIYRDDATGDIILSWDGGSADVYYLTEFSTDDAYVSLEASNVASPYVCQDIKAQDGKSRYWRIAIPEFKKLNPDYAGKFDFQLYELFNYVSTPLEIVPATANSLDDVLGTQLTAGTDPNNADLIYSYVNGEWKQAFLKTGYGWLGILETFDADKGYSIKINEGNPKKMLTLVGNVSITASREVELVQEFNLVGHTYPIVVDLDDTELDQVLTSGTTPSNSDRIYVYITSDTGGEWKQAFLKTGEGWVGTLNGFSPGRSYWIYKQAAGSVTWFYPKPY